MKIECSIEKLKKALMAVERVTGKNFTLPVLESILFISKNKSLILRATNLSIGIETKIPVKVIKEGTVAIKGNTLISLFSVLNLKDNINVSLELKENNLVIKTKTNNILLKSISAEDFPTIPIIKGDEFIISSKKLIEGFKSVYYSASLSEVKPEIGSIYIYTEGSYLIFVATDSFRLAEKRIKIKDLISFDGILIPFKNAIEIIKIFEDNSEDVKITLQKNQISLTTSNIYLTSRVIDGIFPDYKQIIPKESTTEAVVLKQDLLYSLKVANIFSDKFNQVNFLIKPKNKVFEINAQNTDIGENTTVISGALNGEDVSVNFNYKYIIDCFQSIPSDSINLKLNGNNKAMIITGISDQSFRYLIMPMNK